MKWFRPGLVVQHNANWCQLDFTSIYHILNGKHVKLLPNDSFLLLSYFRVDQVRSSKLLTNQSLPNRGKKQRKWETAASSYTATLKNGLIIIHRTNTFTHSYYLFYLQYMLFFWLKIFSKMYTKIFLRCANIIPLL